MKNLTPNRMILVTIIIMDLLAGIEFDIFVPSFPQLQNYFNLSPFWVEALLSVNFLGYCVSLFFTGSLADRYGRKPIILLGLWIFIVGSIICLLATLSYNFLLIGRILQGIGVAAPAILSFLIIADHYPLKQQQFLLAILNGFMNTAAGLAPVIGSYITMYFNWQGNFQALLIIAVVALIMVTFYIPHSKSSIIQKDLPVIDYMTLLRSKPLLLLVAHIVIILVPYWIFVGMSSLLYLKDLGVSLSHFGYYQGILALVFAIGSVSFGFIVKRYDQIKMLYIGLIIYIIGLFFVSLATFFYDKNPLFITCAFLPFIIGQIIPCTILYPLCLNFVPQAKGRISAILQGARLILCAISLQLAGYFYNGTFRNTGIMIIGFIIAGAITLIYVIRNNDLMKLIK